MCVDITILRLDASVEVAWILLSVVYQQSKVLVGQHGD